MKTLETDRLILRPFREDDAEDFYAYARVEGVGEAAGWTHHRSIDESRAILADFIKKDDVYALELKQTGRVIGSLGLHAVNNGEEYNPQRELGYVLSRDHWGKGLMSEAAARAVSYAFEDMALNTLWCAHFIDNDRSRRVIEKTGFRYLKPFVYNTRDGRHLESMLYILTREDYENRLKTTKGA
ncbi:MAG: GNAT family N-acetyltransferase [Clostridiales bacterium]|nr:GNAT family N-acetyltransferase [Clostridiales bacterium]